MTNFTHFIQFSKELPESRGVPTLESSIAQEPQSGKTSLFERILPLCLEIIQIKAVEIMVEPAENVSLAGLVSPTFEIAGSEYRWICSGKRTKGFE
jgi:hypothetical protein